MRPPVVILCGGRGTRLRERTESVPKAVAELNDLWAAGQAPWRIWGATPAEAR